MTWNKAFQKSKNSPGNEDVQVQIETATLALYLGDHAETVTRLENAENILSEELPSQISELRFRIDIWKLWTGLGQADEMNAAYSKVQSKLLEMSKKYPVLLTRTLCHVTGCTYLQDILSSEKQVIQSFETYLGQMVLDPGSIPPVTHPHDFLKKARNAVARKNLPEAERWAYLARMFDTSNVSWAFETPELAGSILLGEIYALNRDHERARKTWNRAYEDFLPQAEQDLLNFDGYRQLQR